jgi:hypothetical protein
LLKNTLCNFSILLSKWKIIKKTLNKNFLFAKISALKIFLLFLIFKMNPLSHFFSLNIFLINLKYFLLLKKSPFLTPFMDVPINKLSSKIIQIFSLRKKIKKYIFFIKIIKILIFLSYNNILNIFI